MCPRAARSRRRRSSSRAATTGRCSRSTWRRAPALSVQYTGFSPTTELDAFRRFDLARNVDDFRDAMQFFDVGGQHFTYADSKGNIAYFTNAEVPIREDLQAGMVDGEPAVPAARRYRRQRVAPGHRTRSRTSRCRTRSCRSASCPRWSTRRPGSSCRRTTTRPATPSTTTSSTRSGPDGGISYLGFFHNGFRAGRITDMVRAAVAQGSDHRGRRRDACRPTRPPRRSVLHSDHHERAGPRQAQLHAGAGRAGQGPAHRRGGRSARPGGTSPTRPASRRGTTPPTSTAGSARRRSRRSTTAWRPRSTRCGAAGSPST